MDPRLLAALVGAAAVALGWLFSSLRDRAAERRRRREKAADIQRALRAEIRAHVHQLQMNGLETHKADMLGRMEREESFVVMVPSETHATVFHAMVGQIDLLPATAVEPVVLYYSQIISVANFADDIRSERYAALNADRRKAIYGHFIDMKIEARRMGGTAVDALDEGITLLSSPAVDRSGPGSGA